MRPAVLVLLLAATACGTFTPLALPGPAALSGCLVYPDSGRVAAGVPVFLVNDDVASAEVRTGADGCFAFQDVPSGRQLLVANDFHGQGLVEPVRLYAGQHQSLSPRYLASLTLNPVLPGLRGVGAGEALGLLTWRDGLTCTDAGARLTSLSQNALVDIDGTTGAVTRRLPPVLAEWVLPAPEHGSAFAELGSLRWRGSGALIDTPFDGGTWFTFDVRDDAFQAQAVEASTGARAWVYGTSGHTWNVGPVPCDLLPSGACARVDVAPGLVHLRRWTSAGPALDDVPLTDGQALRAEVHADDGLRHLLLIDDPAGAFVLRVVAGSAPEVVQAFPGARVPPPAPYGSASPEDAVLDAAPAHPGSLSFRLVVEATGAQLWGRALLGEARAETVAFPAIPPGALRVPSRGAASACPRPTLQWVEHVNGDHWAVTRLEHLGATTRLRTLSLPSADRPDYALYDSTLPGSEYFPGFDLASTPDGAWEVLSTGGGLAVLAAGATLDAARSFPTLGLGAVPACAAGRSLFVRGNLPDQVPQALRYDIQRISDELARSP